VVERTKATAREVQHDQDGQTDREDLEDQYPGDARPMSQAA
jgi:hypothetical protein